MRIIELVMSKSLPRRAGKAKLEYVDGQPATKDGPSRLKDVIRIPTFGNPELFPLEDSWSQFLLMENPLDGSRDRAVWFGGTDEEPFLVQMDPQVIHFFMKDGPEGFYRAIQPDALKLNEKLNQPVRRQGDIFAVRMPSDWPSIQVALLLVGARDTKLSEGKDIRVFGTRHMLSGVCIGLERSGRSSVGLAEGVLTAPDHAPLELKGGPHLFAQTQYLFNPQNAD